HVRLGLPSFPTRRSSDLTFVTLTDYLGDPVVPASQDANKVTWLAEDVQGGGWDPRVYSIVLEISGDIEGGTTVTNTAVAHAQGKDRKSTRLNSSHVKISY